MGPHKTSDSLVQRQGARAAVWHFVQLLERFVALANREGAKIVGFDGPAPRRFMALAPPTQVQVLEHFESYIEVCEDVASRGHSLQDDRQMLWAALVRLKLRPDAKVFSELGETDILEIYLVPDFVQVFRSFRFFYLCSYTLDDLFCRPWWELYQREDSATRRIMEVSETAARGPDHGTAYYNIGPHVLEERESPQRFRSLQEPRFVAPLYDETRSVAGMINVVKVFNVLTRKENGQEIDLWPEAMARGASGI